VYEVENSCWIHENHCIDDASAGVLCDMRKQRGASETFTVITGFPHILESHGRSWNLRKEFSRHRK